MSDASQLAPEPVDTGPEEDASGDAEAPDPLVGLIVDSRYRVLERLAEGGMGTVYRAEHIALHKEVAIKLVQDSGNADHAMRFLREAVLTSRIDHPNVISAIDYGTFDRGAAYLVMSLVDGPTLAHVMRVEPPMSWLRAAEIGAQIADAVGAAQEQGIVHRDLKPENIVLQPAANGAVVVKVLDFGIAKYARDSLAPPQVLGAQRVTRLGVVVGTPGYMAPEQAVGMRADHRADLYAIGVMLWECLAGRRLWDHDDVQKLVTAQLGSRPPLLRAETGDPTIPEAFEQLVAELLATRPERRPQSALEAGDRLRALIEAERRMAPPRAEPANAPGPGSTATPPSTDTVFIDAAVAGWRAGTRKPARDAQAPIEQDEEQEQPTARFLALAARDAQPQPPTQVGFRAQVAGALASGAGAVDSAESALDRLHAERDTAEPETTERETTEREVTGREAAEPDAPPLAVVSHAAFTAVANEDAAMNEDAAAIGAAELAYEPRAFKRVQLVVPLALATLALVLWAALPGEAPATRAPAPARAPATARALPQAQPAAIVASPATPKRATPALAAVASTMRAPALRSTPAPARSRTGAARARAEIKPPGRVPAAKPEPVAVAPVAAGSQRELGTELRARARAHFRGAEFELAAQTYRLAIKASPEHPGAYAGLGASQLALGDARGAIASYQQAVRRAPASSGFHAALGRAYLMARDRSQAIAEYRKAVALDPANEIAVKALARLTPP